MQPADLRGFGQCHFFAGIGGWSLALRLAGWDDARPVWTGSCPCQPFSLAWYRAKGTKDERDLWPLVSRLITVAKPDVVFGEQVPNAILWGWYDRLCDEMEAEGYACGATVLPACGLGAPSVSQRLHWCATKNPSPDGFRWQGRRQDTVAPWSLAKLEELVQADLRLSLPTGRTGAVAHGVPCRVAKLRAIGNAIVPQVAAEFIGAFMEIANG